MEEYNEFIKQSENEMKTIKEYSDKVVKELKILENRMKTKTSEGEKLKQEIEFLKNEKINFQKKINEYVI